MHSFHHSRGRVLFDSTCALALSASLTGAWLELGTLALLPAAAVTGLYGLVRLTDMRGPRTVVAVTAEPVTVEEAVPVVEQPVEVPPAPEPEAVAEDVPAKPARTRKRKSPRKAEVVAEVEAVVEPAPLDTEALTAELKAVVPEPPSAEAEDSFKLPEPEASGAPEEHAPVTPLFEPEPYIHQQRAVFGRKAR